MSAVKRIELHAPAVGFNQYCPRLTPCKADLLGSPVSNLNVSLNVVFQMEIDLAATSNSMMYGRHRPFNRRYLSYQALRPLIVTGTVRPFNDKPSRVGNNCPAVGRQW